MAKDGEYWNEYELRTMNSKEEGELFQDTQPRRQILKRNIEIFLFW